MKQRRFFLFVAAFFIFLYIGPVNLLPYDTPLVIVRPSQETKDFKTSATDYYVAVAADGDDDIYDDGVHKTTYTTQEIINYAGPGTFIGNVRFQLNIDKDVTIESATITYYELADGGTVDFYYRRINETNVGDLEADGSMPSTVEDNKALHDLDGSAPEWQETNVTDMVQDQVNLADWENGFYIGFQMEMSAVVTQYNQLEEYSHAGTHHAYMNVTYSAEEEPPEDSATEWFTDDIVGFGWQSTNTPSAWYDVNTDRTYVAFQGDLDAIDGDGDLDPHILYYDHLTAMWSNVSWIAYNPLNDWPPPSYDGDTHGSPCLWIDNDGYIHVLFGSHASKVIQHVVSEEPNNITSFENSTDPTTTTWQPSYPAIHYDSDNDVVHLFYRGYTDGRYMVYQNSTDNGVTWSAEQIIIDMGTASGQDNRPYHGLSAFTDNQLIHIAINNHSMYPPAQAGADHDFFYFIFNVTSKHVYNITGYDFGDYLDEDEIQNCRFYEYPFEGGTRSGIPNLYLDENDYPHIFYYVGDTEILPNPSTWTLRYSYWDGAAWQGMNVSEHTVSGSSGCAIVYSADNITMWSNTNVTDEIVHQWTWNGTDWTDEGAIEVTNTYFVSFPTVPEHYFLGNRTELQVIFTEYEGGSAPFDGKCKGWAYGSRGLLGRNYGNVPVNEQTPTCNNLDDTDNLYARYKAYNIAVNVSDGDGFADISYVTLSVYDNTRTTLYWTVKFTEDTATFSELTDNSNMIYLDTGSCSNASSGNTLNITFSIWVHWNHTDLSNIDLKQYVRDGNYSGDLDWYEVNWDIETRLDLSSFSLNDGSGTVDRGDYDTIGSITASGSVVYYASALYPATSEVDVWIICAEVSGSGWSDTSLSSGAFSVAVDSDDEIGLDTYNFRVVMEGEGIGGTNLLHATHQDTYIADRLVFDIQADDETPINGQQVNFTLTITYDYDDSVCTTYQVIISRNDVWWHSFVTGNVSLFNDTASGVAYAYTSYNLTSETTHGLTKFMSNTETVTWSAVPPTTTTTPPITTTPTTTTPTTTGFFYDLFLSVELWSLFGPLGLVVIGYFITMKAKELGIFFILVDSIVIAVYLSLIEVISWYWWHVIILILGVIQCTIRLISR